MLTRRAMLRGSLICIVSLAACGRANGGGAPTSAPPIATTAPAANTPTVAAAAARPSPTATAPAKQATATPDTRAIVLGTPVVLTDKVTRKAVAVSVTNTSDGHVSFVIKPALKGTKVGTTPQRPVSNMPPGATWTVIVGADEVEAKHHDLADLRVESLRTVVGAIGTEVARKIAVGQPDLAGVKETQNIKVELTNGHDKRTLFNVTFVFVRDGGPVGVAYGQETLEAGQTRKVPLHVEGVAEGQISPVEIAIVGFI